MLVLRGSMSPVTRHRYKAVLHDQSKLARTPGSARVEFLFERLAVRWIVFDVPTEGQKELLARYRMATQEERRWVRDDAARAPRRAVPRPRDAVTSLPRLLLGSGPSPVPERVLDALAQPTIGHLDPQFGAIMDEVAELLRATFRTANRVAFPV